MKLLQLLKLFNLKSCGLIKKNKIKINYENVNVKMNQKMGLSKTWYKGLLACHSLKIGTNI
jgi:hypothetical protein